MSARRQTGCVLRNFSDNPSDDEALDMVLEMIEAETKDMLAQNASVWELLAGRSIADRSNDCF